MGNFGNEAWNVGKYFIPVVGTGYAIRDAWRDPSWENIGSAGLSLVGDVGTIFGIGTGIKAVVAANKVNKFRKEALTAYEAAHAIARGNYDKAILATNRAKKARSTSDAVTMLGGGDRGMSRVIQYEKAAQNAEFDAKKAMQAYSDATRALNGSIPVQTRSYLGTGVGGYFTPSAYNGVRYIDKVNSAEGKLNMANDAWEAAKTAANQPNFLFGAGSAFGSRVPQYAKAAQKFRNNEE